MQALCLLQVHAHPDDEASKGAGTTARYVAEGARCVLVTCTGGEAGDILNVAVDTPETRANLKEVRLGELRESADILGYHAVHLLGYRDSGMPKSEDNARADAFVNADFDDAVDRLIAIVRAERPQVILTYGDDHSSYPHPDHIRAHEITLAAFDAAADPARAPGTGDPWQPSKLYYMGWTMRRVRTMHEAIESLGKESPFKGWLTDDSGTDSDHRFRTRIDVAPYVPTRSKALLAHRTQVAPDSMWFTLPDEMLAEVYPWEDYILARTTIATIDETAEESDLFAGLR